jgi:hypothetical protein
MFLRLRQRLILGSAGLMCAACVAMSPCHAQVSDEEVDKSLQQLEKLIDSGLYSEEQIAAAKEKLLDSIVNLGPGGSARSTAARLSDNELYQDYRQRLQDRREQALDLRRQYAMMRPPARGWLAYRMPFPMMPLGNMIEQGWVQQPPVWVPPRRYYVLPYDNYGPGYNYGYGYDYDYYGEPGLPRL